ncbi:ROK family protein [Foetidibacter luteolus]|uniref:ROK family protein n=1 Tax=Foetidibacter luteolus TaxID=2608880 RepID=UPI00129B297F|nr:ROK family protein [Foetidibacter luteolus]
MGEKSLLYRRKIMKQLYFSKMLSCADLSDKIGKSLPLTTKMLNELIDNGFVTETGYAASTGGRRPIMYSIKPDVVYVVAVAMDQLITRIAIMDMQNRYLTGIEKMELPLANNPKALPVVAEKIAELITTSGIDRSKIAGIGIGMPGFVDATKGINHTFLDAGGKSINEYISEKIKLPVFIDNDSSLIALAELKFGAARKKKNAMVINASWGVGLGLVLNGELFRGQNGFAGELSHIPLFNNNKLCSCGKSGCLETEASLQVVVQKAIEGLKAGKVSLVDDLPADHVEQACDAIVAAAGKGDKFAIELLSEAGYNIGRGVAILIHLLNPQIIILSGRGSSAGKIWQAPIQQALNEHCIPKLAANTEIEISSLGYHAEMIGAAALVMDNYEKSSLKKDTATEKVELSAVSSN